MQRVTLRLSVLFIGTFRFETARKWDLTLLTPSACRVRRFPENVCNRQTREFALFVTRNYELTRRANSMSKKCNIREWNQYNGIDLRVTISRNICLLSPRLHKHRVYTIVMQLHLPNDQVLIRAGYITFHSIVIYCTIIKIQINNFI